MFDKTIKELLEKNQNNAPGFDALRIVLATSIVLFHSFFVCYPENSQRYYQAWSNPYFHPLLKAILPMFFFLSGFLVCKSAFRLRSVPIFLLYRFLRIFPALLVEVVLSAVVLGGLMTVIPKSDYYSSTIFFNYFKNIIGDVQLFLPGVFRNHPCNVVNGNLWTLRPEFYCYEIITVLMLTGILFRRKIFLFLFFTANLIFFYFLVTLWTWGDPGVVFVRPHLLIYAFFVGVCFYIYADRIVIKRPLFFASIVGLVFFNLKYTTFLGVISSCYLCISIGFINLKKFPLIGFGDFSYGIYLYGFPIQQTIWHFFPITDEWWMLFLLAYPVTLVFSIASWWLIERPFLKLKRYLV